MLLLNDDIEVATPGWIERMVMYSSSTGWRGRRPAALEDGRLQHISINFKAGLPAYTAFSSDSTALTNADQPATASPAPA